MIHRFLFPALCLALAPVAFAQNSPITLTVDTTHTPEKILHVRESIPVQPGPLHPLLPQVDSRRARHPTAPSPASPASTSPPATGKEIPWQRDLLDVFTFHVDIPAGVTQLDAAYDFIEADGFSATDKLLVLEWNEVALYPAGTPSEDLTYNATLISPTAGNSAPRCPSTRSPAIASSSSPSPSICSSTRP